MASERRVSIKGIPLTVERKTGDGHFEPLRRSRVEGLYPYAYGFSWEKASIRLQT